MTEEFHKKRPGVRFSKVHKLYGPLSGVKIPFVSEERIERISSLSFFSFCYLEKMLKEPLSKTSGWQFHKWLLGPEKFSGTFEKRGPARVLREGWLAFTIVIKVP